MGSLINFLFNFFGRHLTIKAAELGFQSALEVAKFLAWKTLIVFLVFTGSQVLLSITLYNIFDVVFSYVTEQVNNSNNVEGVSFTVTLSGIAAYFADVLRLDDCLKILIGAVITRMSLKFIPFMRF